MKDFFEDIWENLSNACGMFLVISTATLVITFFIIKSNHDCISASNLIDTLKEVFFIDYISCLIGGFVWGLSDWLNKM